jgi:hypothetical protein
MLVGNSMKAVAKSHGIGLRRFGQPALWLPVVFLLSCGSPVIVRNLGYEPRPPGALPPEDGTAFGLAPAPPGLACETLRDPQTELPETSKIAIVDSNYLLSINEQKNEVSAETFDQKSRRFVVERVHDLQQRRSITLAGLSETLPQTDRPAVLSFERNDGKNLVSLLQLDKQGYKKVNSHLLGSGSSNTFRDLYQSKKDSVIIGTSDPVAGTSFWRLSTLPSSSTLTPTLLAKHPSARSFKIIGTDENQDRLILSEQIDLERSKLWIVGKDIEPAIQLFEGPMIDAIIKQEQTPQEQTLFISVDQNAVQSFHPFFSQFAVGGVWSLSMGSNLQLSPAGTFQSSVSWKRVSAIAASSLILRKDSLLAWLQQLSYFQPDTQLQDVYQSHRFFELSKSVGKQVELQPACFGPMVEKLWLIKDIGYIATASNGTAIFIANP